MHHWLKGPGDGRPCFISLGGGVGQIRCRAWWVPCMVAAQLNSTPVITC